MWVPNAESAFYFSKKYRCVIILYTPAIRYRKSSSCFISYCTFLSQKRFEARVKKNIPVILHQPKHIVQCKMNPGTLCRKGRLIWGPGGVPEHSYGDAM